MMSLEYCWKDTLQRFFVYMCIVKVQAALLTFPRIWFQSAPVKENYMSKTYDDKVDESFFIVNKNGAFIGCDVYIIRV